MKAKQELKRPVVFNFLILRDMKLRSCMQSPTEILTRLQI